MDTKPAKVQSFSRHARSAVKRISSGLPCLDWITGGGYPQGRLVRIIGPESAGKSTLALHAAAMAQQTGKVLYLNPDGKLSGEVAANIGVDLDRLHYAIPETLEQLWLTAFDAIESRKPPSLIVIDPETMCPTQTELEGEMDTYGSIRSRTNAEGVTRLMPRLAKVQTTVLVVSQLRYRQGVTFGSPECPTGGRALKDASSLSLDVRRIQTLKKGQDEFGVRLKIKITQNTVGKPFRVCESDLVFGQGCPKHRGLVDLADYLELISYGTVSTSKFQGMTVPRSREELCRYFQEPEDLALLESVIQKVLNPQPEEIELVVPNVAEISKRKTTKKKNEVPVSAIAV